MKNGTARQKQVGFTILAIVLMALLLMTACAPSQTTPTPTPTPIPTPIPTPTPTPTLSIVKPTVGYVPQGWYCSEENPYGTYEESDGTKWGLITYTDKVDYDFVQVFYGDVPPELKGKGNDGDALIARAIVEAGTFEPAESKTMVVAGSLAGCVKAYDPVNDVTEMEVVFVEGSTCVDIYAYYDATYEDEAEVISLIDSIGFRE